jgi:hypothetical protein
MDLLDQFHSRREKALVRQGRDRAEAGGRQRRRKSALGTGPSGRNATGAAAFQGNRTGFARSEADGWFSHLLKIP